MKTIFTLFVAVLILNLKTFCQSGPELIFVNPVLVNGTANQQGAVYRFPNVTAGVDATIKLKKFSRNDILMPTVDNAILGWDKAFQPEFGLPGTVAPFQNWYIDFEITFYKAGTNTKQKLDTVDFTALDVDGDGHSINEYVTYDRPFSITYSTLSSLVSTPVGFLGQVALCEEEGISSPLVSCHHCGGTGLNGGSNIDPYCDGSGFLHSLCQHAYTAGTGSNVNGPVNNFAAIDTSATQVMALYRYLNTNKIKFRYGAKSGALASTGSGIRLNSMWFREFSLAPMSTLPVKLTSFSATLNNNNKVDLKWTTASEINVSHFIVEKSTDGVNFSDAGMVFAYGNTTSKVDYSLADNISNIQSGIIYYRLRSVDVDGKTQYSDIRIIRISKQAESNITIAAYPNPATSEVRITIPANWQNKKVVYEVFSVNGQTAKRVETANSSQTETLSMSNLNSGLYIVKVTCEGKTAQQKIVKQ